MLHQLSMIKQALYYIVQLLENSYHGWPLSEV